MRRRATVLVLLLTVLTAACTSTESTLDPAAINAPPAPLPDADAAAPTQNDAAATAASGTALPPGGQLASTGQSARVQIAPIIGAPIQAIGPLSDRLAAQAPTRRFSIVGAGDQSATHVLKGFFSTSPEGRDTIVYYVWDVVDRDGNRVHRFSGQEKVAGTTDGWAAVTDATMQAIADRTADGFALWFAGRAG